MEFKNLVNVDFDTLFNAFECAFSDYEIHFEKEEVRSMLTRRGYDPRLSFAAFENDRIVAFTLNGIGVFNGASTAYDTGTGTVREFRGKGLASKIFNHSIPYLKEAGIQQYLLEVLKNNSKAIAVYRSLNFQTAREFDCFRQKIADVAVTRSVDISCKIESVGLDFVRMSQVFGDFMPSWQNGMESIERAGSGLFLLGATINDIPVGYCVLDPDSGDLTQIAVRKEFRRKGVASLLLDEAIKHMNSDFVKVINVDADSRGLSSFLEYKNIPLASKQYEMILQL